MSSKDDGPWVKFFHQAFLNGTRGLTAAQIGVYWIICCQIYEADGPIRRDDARLAKSLAMPKAKLTETLDYLIEQGHVTESQGHLTNGKAEKVITDRTRRIQNSIHAASKSPHVQRAKTKQNQREDEATAKRQLSHKDKDKEKKERDPDDDDDARARALSAPTIREEILTLLGADPVTGMTHNGRATALGGRVDMHMVEGEWLGKMGLSRDTILAVIADVMRRKRDGPPTSLRYFRNAIEDEWRRLNEPTPSPEIDREQASASNPTRRPVSAPRSHSAAAADDAVRERIEGAARNRSPSPRGIRFGRDHP